MRSWELRVEGVERDEATRDGVSWGRGGGVKQYDVPGKGENGVTRRGVVGEG